MSFSIQNKMNIIFSVVIIVPMMLTAFFFNNLTKDTLIHQIRDADLKTIETINKSIDHIVVKTEQSGTIIANDRALEDFLRSTLALAKDDKSHYLSADPGPVLDKYLSESNQRYISLLSADGYLIGERSLNSERLNYILNKHLFTNLDKDQINWQRMYTIEDTLTHDTQKVFPCIVPVNDYHTQDNLGYVIIYLNERDLYSTYSTYKNRIYILNDEQLIVSNEDETNLQKDHYQATNIGYSYVLQNESSVIDNKVVLTTEALNQFGWQMVMITSFDEYTPKGIYSTNYFISTLFIVILFTIVMGFVISRYITKPIRKLTHAMKTVDNGNLSVRYDYKSNDEIGQMGKRFNTMLNTIQNLMKNIVDEERLKQNYKLQMIQAQINPHFLYNALEMINSLIRLDLKEKAIETTSNISDFYRLTLSDGVNIITIKEEIALINHYLFIQNMRYVEFIDFIIDFDPLILDYLIPKSTLQPIVENSIYHGLKECATKGTISIRGYLDDGKVVFIIEDNGKGMTEERLRELSDTNNQDTNFGINCTKDRLALYFGDQATVTMDSQLNQFTRTTLTIPTKMKSEEI